MKRNYRQRKSQKKNQNKKEIIINLTPEMLINQILDQCLGNKFSDKNNPIKCSICGNIIEGYGHNPEPVNSGRCCDKCNSDVVLPTRHMYIMNGINFRHIRH